MPLVRRRACHPDMVLALQGCVESVKDRAYVRMLIEA
jgi:hypothetical protein